ncbi:DNA cytosine methyltransferase, partial [Streptomyces rochei]
WKSGASNLLERNARPLNEVAVNLLAGIDATPAGPVPLDERWVASDGTDFGPAIRRWERITGRAAPCPTEPGMRGNRRLSPLFTEWMMGLPEGWVTAVPGIPRKEQLKILGNGVVPRQAHHAYGWLLGATTARPALGVAA